MNWLVFLGAAFVGAFLATLSLRRRLAPKWVLLLALPALAIALGFQWNNWSLPGDVKAASGEEIYDLTGKLFTLDGESVDVSDLGGKIVFMNFWATWCGPCRAEMPSMAELYEELGNQGLVMLAISDEDPETVRNYLEDSPYPFTILLDPEGILFRRLRVRGLPTTFVFNEKRELVLEHVGGYNWSTPQLIEEFRRILHQAD